MLKLKNVRDAPDETDGSRFLVERLWPRGIKKESLKMDRWLKEVAPTTELRKWFNHDPAKWAEFQKRYSADLDKIPEAWQPILDAEKKGAVTLLFSSHDAERNNVVALKNYLERETKPANRNSKVKKPFKKNRGNVTNSTQRRS